LSLWRARRCGSWLLRGRLLLRLLGSRLLLRE
jgi:hypothetical protein